MDRTIAGLLGKEPPPPAKGLVVSVPLERAYPCRLVSATSEDVRIAVGEARPDEFEPMAMALVMLLIEGYTSAFLTHVLEARSLQPEGLSIRLRLPEQSLTARTRLVYRTPLIADHGLEVRIHDGKAAGENAEPLDISDGGIGLRFPPEHDPRASRGDELTLELKHGGTRVALKGTIKHTDGAGRYGILFSEAAANGGVVPRPEFRQIVTTLQRHWLRNRAT